MVNGWIKPGAVGAVSTYFGGYQFPEWAPLTASGLVIAGIGALLATGKINSLLPDPPRVRLVQMNANGGDPLTCWSLSPDKFAGMRVEWGPLYPHEQAHGDVYECYAYDPSSNVAVGTWRHSFPGSSLMGRHDTDDALDVVGELRGDLEPAARRGQELGQALPTIMRKVRHDTMEAQDAALGPSAPMITDQPTVDETITSELPEELRPGRLQNGDLRDLLEATGDQDDNRGDWSDGLEMIFDDDLTDDAFEPVPTDPLVNDGGNR